MGQLAETTKNKQEGRSLSKVSPFLYLMAKPLPLILQLAFSPFLRMTIDLPSQANKTVRNAGLSFLQLPCHFSSCRKNAFLSYLRDIFQVRGTQAFFSMSVFLFLSATSAYFASAQQLQKPLTQSEYVQLLFELERNPRKREEIIQVLRVRGIDFEVTDGIRSLTATKSRNDTELRRVLEEAGRRRKNPAIAALPSEKESFEILAKAKAIALKTVEEMPDFVVKQAIQRFIAYAGTNNFQILDRLVVVVSYRADGREEYKVLSLNGVLQDDSNYKPSYEEVGGTSSTGEFVTVLATIFKPESETKFRLLDTDVINQRRAFIYEFEIKREKARQQIVSVTDSYASTISGMKGRIWIDRENFRVLRIESEATEIPSDFPIKAASRKIDYDWVTIADRRYFLPIFSEVRLTFRQDGKILEARNLIRFREYRKFGSEVRVLDEDEEILNQDR